MIRKYFRSDRIFSLLLLLLLISSCEHPSPNIVLINIDDMGWRDVGFMGSRYYSTPNIDRLAESGLIFTNAYAAASNCAPSRACLMSGRWAQRHGIYTVASPERGKSRDRKLIPTPNLRTLPADMITLPEVLQEYGYTTCHAGKWHLSKDPLEYGFDVNIGGNHSGAPRSYYPPYGNVPLEAPNDEYLTDNIMDHVLDFIHKAETPFFLYYSPYAVHVPLHPVDSLLDEYRDKPAWMGQGNPSYATMIDNLDRNIGRLLGTLESGPGLPNTLLIFTSDNGGHFVITRQKPLRSGKGSYYEGGIRVPMAIAWKGKINKGRLSDEPVTNIDLFPTLLEAAGIVSREENIPVPELDGTSLMPVLLKNESLPERPLFWHFPIYLEAYDPETDETRDPLFRTRPGSAVRLGDWKLHQYFEDGGLELYNLREDTGERVNLVDTHPDKAEELLQILENWRRETGAPVPTELNPEYDPLSRF
jgi:arylsulfatase A-like enzyme